MLACLAILFLLSFYISPPICAPYAAWMQRNIGGCRITFMGARVIQSSDLKGYLKLFGKILNPMLSAVIFPMKMFGR